MIGGTNELMDSLITTFNSPSVFLEATSTIKITPKTRKLFQKTWTTAKPASSMLFGLLITNKKVIYIMRPKKYNLSHRDLALLLNLVYSSSSFRSIEAWTPACLPDFNDTGFLHCYTSFLTHETCLILLSTDKNSFYDQSKFRHQLVEGMEKTELVKIIDDEIKMNNVSVGIFR
jgi:hypothetical protein